MNAEKLKALTVVTARVTRGGEPLMPLKVTEVIQKVCGKENRRT